MELIVDAWTSDVGTTEDLVEAIAARTEQSWNSGADMVLFPEYAWAALDPSPCGVAEVFQRRVWPLLQNRLTRDDKLAVLGTTLMRDEATGRLYNRAIIMSEGRWVMQDKLCMTPWESGFQGGDTLRMINFRGLRTAVLICLDIEVPEFSALLRGQAVDLLLVPSATETLLGVERVTRCASARAVELGCAVVVSPLVGQGPSEWVDENLGKLACYLPSQSAFSSCQRSRESPVYHTGFHTRRFAIRTAGSRVALQSIIETNPSLLPREAVSTVRLEQPLTQLMP